MTLALLQPVFIPDLYDVAVMQKSDMIVIQDNEPWSRKGRTHRAMIRTPDGTQYLNVPVKTEDRKKPIRDVRIDQSGDWISPILKALKYNYRNSIYYDFYEPEIRADFQKGKEFIKLISFSNYLKKRIFEFLELKIDAAWMYGSEMENYSSKPDTLAQHLGAGTYYQEHDARHYQRQGKNRSVPDFTHPVYRQHFEGFEPGCCILDLLFQYGPESFRVIDKT